MQSGITISPDLATAFSNLISDASARALIATISSETITPTTTLPSTHPSDFHADLPRLTPHLSPTTPAYILLRRHPAPRPDAYIAITYIPDSAPVRLKTLYASTRLTLVRDLGPERFCEQLFVTELAELTPEGWAKHEAHEGLAAPLTEEEEVLGRVKRAEAEAAGGTAGRRLETGGKLSIKISQEARGALEGLKERGKGWLVQLDINLKSEEVGLVEEGEVAPGSLGGAISDEVPRYSFYKYGGEGVVFLYSCPGGSKVRERMVYASSKEGLVAAVRADIGLEIVKKFEVSSPTEITAATLEDEFRPKQEEKTAFSRPKRPGRR